MTRIVVMTLLFALAGCGNKGPLVLPDAGSRDAARSADAPVETVAPEPAATEPATSAKSAPVEPVPGASGTPAR